MQRIIIALSIIISSISVSFAQSKTATPEIAAAFAQAYTMHPNLPKGLLEAMAESASHTQNLAPTEGMDHHHGPERFGLFALIEDGEGYFKNTLVDVCTATHTDITEFKKSSVAQILAVAAYLDLQTEGNVWALRTAKPLAMALCEIPDNSAQNAYAREQYAYATYHELAKERDVTNGSHTVRFLTTREGCKSVVVPRSIEPTNWFSNDNFAILSGKNVRIENGVITGDNGALFVRPNASSVLSRGINGNNTIFTTDYAPALWVASPNFSSRGATAISAVTIHTTQGSYAGSISWFQNTASQVSAHYVIRSSDGQVTQCVLESNKAWHVGNENPYTIGIEHEGYIADATWYTTAMYTSSAALVRDICTSGYGILPTTCYNGPASSGYTLLSTAIKIKGHQHFLNQSHTDPGINWNWTLYYSLINPVTCAAPAGLAASGASVNSVNLAWTATAGSTGYLVEYKTSAATTWTALNTTTNSATLTALANTTTYNWRVTNKCSTTSSSVLTNGTDFTTLAPPCTVATALTTSAITASGSTLTWAAVAGAASYTLQYKTATATAWISLNVTGTTYTLTGLAASTAYNWQVMTNCATNASSYATGANFTTLAPPCTVPSGLTSNSIFTTKATIAWAAVTGATGYTVEYKTSAATTWTVGTQTTTSKALTGLAASTVYQFRVKTTCSATSSSAYSATGTFTTLASCYDANEANNSSGTATPLASGSFKYGKLCSATTTADADWFNVTTTATSSIVVSVTELPANYNLDLYINGAWTAASTNAGTTSESLTRSAQPAGTYLYRVYSATTADVNSLLDYKISVTITPTPAAMTAGGNATDMAIENTNAAKTAQSIANVRVIPNPVSDVAQIYFDLATAQKVSVAVTDNLGRTIFMDTKTYEAGIQNLELLTADWTKGVYYVTVKGINELKSVKIVK
jgi:N-acetylmuramoyl-L-alanine amidase/Secretion system C-terminal sorting domain/Fibronectin type III domain